MNLPSKINIHMDIDKDLSDAKGMSSLLFDVKDMLSLLFNENEIINRCVKISTCVSSRKDHESIVEGILDFFNVHRYMCNVKKGKLYRLLDKYEVIWLDIDTMEIVTDEQKICLLNMLA